MLWPAYLRVSGGRGRANDRGRGEGNRSKKKEGSRVVVVVWMLLVGLLYLTQGHSLLCYSLEREVTTALYSGNDYCREQQYVDVMYSVHAGIHDKQGGLDLSAVEIVCREHYLLSLL
jgi:hypothetical protein